MKRMTAETKAKISAAINLRHDNPLAAQLAAKKKRVAKLWGRYELSQRRCEAVRLKLGNELNELHELLARHGSGTYDAEVEQLGISKSTAWRILREYREHAGLDLLPEGPAPEFVSNETNLATADSTNMGETPQQASARSRLRLQAKDTAKAVHLSYTKDDYPRFELAVAKAARILGLQQSTPKSAVVLQALCDYVEQRDGEATVTAELGDQKCA